jgi:pimeloyl-ACP methyl ester carboxylesterase
MRAVPASAVAGAPLATSTMTADGVRLSLSIRVPPAPPQAAVVIAHGFTGSSADPAVIAVAENLLGAGFAVVTYDARGHGLSDGLCTLGIRERFDVAAVTDVARLLHERVVVVGASMGAIAALGHAASDAGLAGVVTVSSPARWQFPRTARAVLAAVMTQTPPGRRFMASRGIRLADRWTRPRPEEPVALAARLQVPLAVVHGQADRFLPMTAATDLLRAARAPSRLVLVPAMGHAFEPSGFPAIAEAVTWVLAQAPPGAD